MTPIREIAAEMIRRQWVAEFTLPTLTAEQLQAKYGTILRTEEVKAEYIVHAFHAPFIVVTRKADGVIGTLLFQHYPRYFFQFEAYDGDAPLHSLRAVQP